MEVFFYGLFMDSSLLKSQGILVRAAHLAALPNYELQIGERATLVPKEGAQSYGLVMTISQNDLAQLYSESSVSDYQAFALEVQDLGGDLMPVYGYLLPPGKLKGSNPVYAERLHQLCDQLGFPQHYLNHIKSFIHY